MTILRLSRFYHISILKECGTTIPERYRSLRFEAVEFVIPDKVVYLIKGAGWIDTILTSKGLMTSKGFYSPSELELLQWKANFYHRGRDRMNALKLLYPDPPESLIKSDDGTA